MDLSSTLAARREELAESIEDVDFGYEYPGGHNLKPGSELHDYIVDKVMTYARQSENATESAKENWRKLDQTLTAYFPASYDAEARQGHGTNIVIPVSFAALDTFLTYAAGVFGRDPIYKFRGRGSKERRIKAAMLERIVSAGNYWYKERLHLQTFLRDAYVYGIGVASPQWRKSFGRTPESMVITDIVEEVLRGKMGKAKRGDIIRYFEQKLLFEGNELRNIDPYRLLLDTNTPLNHYQESEFIGYLRRTHAMELLRQEEDPETGHFNCKYARMLAEQRNGRSVLWTDDSGRNYVQQTEADDRMRAMDNAVDCIHMFLDLIPWEWGIGSSRYPTKYMATVAADRVLIQFEPCGYQHGMYPVAMAGPNTTGYDTIPVSHLTTTYPAQITADWLISTHVADVLRGLNTSLVVDPSRVDMRDVLSPSLNKIIRLKMSSYGQAGIDQYIKQLPMVNVTASHMVDAQAFIGHVNNILATQDITRGDLSSSPERPTAAGIHAARTGSLSRLGHVVEMVAMQGIVDLAWQEGYNVTQFLGEDVSVSILGRYEEDLRTEFGLPPGVSEMTVGPSMLDGLSFEVEPYVSPAGDENIDAMTEVMKTAMAIEGVPQTVFSQIDVVRLFMGWARKAGFEDVHEFVQSGGSLVPQIVPDEYAAAQAAAGNLVPTGDVLPPTG